MSVCRRSQTEGRNSCSIVSGNVSNCSYSLKAHPFTSSRLSSAYQCFYTREHPKYRGNRVASACGYLNCQRSALSQAERSVTVGRHRIAIACAADGDGDDGCVCARVRARACACVCARACMRACVCACVMCLQYTIKYLTQADNNNN